MLQISLASVCIVCQCTLEDNLHKGRDVSYLIICIKDDSALDSVLTGGQKQHMLLAHLQMYHALEAVTLKLLPPSHCTSTHNGVLCALSNSPPEHFVPCFYSHSLHPCVLC